MTVSSLKPPLILDACCLINLYASRNIEEILNCIPFTIRAADYVLDSEALWVFGGSMDNVRSSKERIDLKSLEGTNLIREALNSDEEESTAVDFAFHLKDDGEAITGAIAFHRKWIMATDDGKATKFLEKQAPSLKILTTLELIKLWTEIINPSPEVLHAVLWNIRERASYRPNRNHSLCEWWDRCIKVEG